MDPDVKIPCSPVAAHVIAKCGGAGRVRRWLKISNAQVHKFKAPKSKGGTGGLIPSWFHKALLDFAGTEGVELVAEDFHEPPHGCAVFPPPKQDNGEAA